MSEVSIQCPGCNHSQAASRFKVAPIPYPAPPKKRNETRKVYFCDRCDLGFMNPVFTAAELKELYSGGEFWSHTDFRLGLKSFAFPYVIAEARWKYLLSKISLGESFRILDIGAGHGCFGMVAAEERSGSFNEYVAVEPDPMMSKHLVENWKTFGHGVKFKQVKEIGEAGGSFDLVVLSHVLEHVEDPKAFLQTALAQLKPGGHLFLEVPNNDLRFKSDVYGHVLFFGTKQIRELLARSDFTLVDAAGYGKSPGLSPLNPNAPGWVRALGQMVHHSKRFLPLAALKFYYDAAYGLHERNEEGTWIRAIAKNP